MLLCVFKLVATVMCYSSGGAGGIFAPALFIGGMLGGSVGYLDRVLLPGSTEQIGAFALVGMGAVFAGIVRAPITSVLIIFEMTNGYGLDPAADDREHDRLRARTSLSAHADLRCLDSAGWNSSSPPPLTDQSAGQASGRVRDDHQSDHDLSRLYSRRSAGTYRRE